MGQFVYENDVSLREFLFAHGVDEGIYVGAVSWVMRMYRNTKYNRRWWSRDNLGKMQGLGTEWSYGISYELDKYTRSINTTAVFSMLLVDTAYADEKISQVETILARTKEANVLLVGEPGVGKIDILIRLGRKISRG